MNKKRSVGEGISVRLLLLRVTEKMNKGGSLRTTFQRSELRIIGF